MLTPKDPVLVIEAPLVSPKPRLRLAHFAAEGLVQTIFGPPGMALRDDKCKMKALEYTYIYIYMCVYVCVLISQGFKNKLRMLVVLGGDREREDCFGE